MWLETSDCPSYSYYWLVAAPYSSAMCLSFSWVGTVFFEASGRMLCFGSRTKNNVDNTHSLQYLFKLVAKYEVDSENCLSTVFFFLYMSKSKKLGSEPYLTQVFIPLVNISHVLCP